MARETNKAYKVGVCYDAAGQIADFPFCVRVNKASARQLPLIPFCTSLVKIFYQDKRWLSPSVLEVSGQLLQHKAACADRRSKELLINGSHLLHKIGYANKMALQI